MILFWVALARIEEKSLLTSFTHVRGLVENTQFGPVFLILLRETDLDKSKLALPF